MAYTKLCAFLYVMTVLLEYLTHCSIGVSRFCMIFLERASCTLVIKVLLSLWITTWIPIDLLLVLDSSRYRIYCSLAVPPSFININCVHMI